MPSPIQIAQKPTEIYYSIANKNNLGQITSTGLSKVEPIHRTSATSSSGPREFRYIGNNVSVRDGFTRFDYEYFRQDEVIPKRVKEIIALCMAIYQRNGLIYNIINLMSDFASQGVRIVHPDPKTQDLYNYWFNEKLGGPERTERIFNMLFRTGNVIIQKATAKIPEGIIRKMQAVAADLEDDDLSDEIPSREIPWRYYIHNPVCVDYLKPNAFIFSDKKYLTIKIAEDLKKLALNPQDEAERDLAKDIPLSVKNAIQNGKGNIVLPPDKVDVLFYKKDDWMPWAIPMIYPIVDDLFLYEKLRLADLTALDGAISKIRVWNLGDIEKGIYPTDAAIQKLGGLIMDTAGVGSVLDLIWGPDLKLQETKTDMSAFLGSEKYQQTLGAIYAGLGVPQMLTGSGKGSNMTDNFIQIKVLVERLEYGRRIVTPFWKKQCELFRNAMKGVRGFNSKIPAEVVYDHMSLTDEAAQAKLLLDLVDRDIISVESIQEDMRRNPAIEKARLRRELEDRTTMPKVSPYHDADPDLSLKKAFVQRGAVTPSEVGVELKPRKPGEKTMVEVQTEQKKLNAPKGKPGQGRPKNQKDTKPRKQRIPLIASETHLMLWTTNTYSTLSNMLLPIFYKKFNKNTVRKFTESETNEFEDFKFGVLSNIEPFSKIDENVVVAAINKPFDNFDMIYKIYAELLNEIPNTAELSINDKRHLQCVAYTRNFECL